MAQVFSNNARTTLASGITDSATALVLTDPTVFSTPSGGDFELLTLTDGANWEVVKMTTNGTSEATVERAHEGTARAWAAGTIVSARITAGTLENLRTPEKSVINEATGTATFGFGGADGVNAVSGFSAIGIGNDALADESNAVAIGAFSTAEATSATAIGASTYAGGASSTAVGNFAAASGANSSAFGRSANAGVDFSVAIGHRADANLVGTCHIAAAPILAKHNATQNDSAELFRYYSAPQITLATQEIDLTNSGESPNAADDIQIIAIPTGAHFYPDEVQVIIESSSSVTGNPDIAVGTSSGGTELLGSTTITATTVRNRTINTTASRHGVTGNIYISLKTAAVATALTGRVLITGVLVEDS